MARTFSFGYNDTDKSEQTVQLPTLSFAKDFVMRTIGRRTPKNSSTETQVILSNITSPLDQPELVTVSLERRADVYKDVDIVPSNIPASKEGFSFVIALDDILRSAETEDPTCCCDDTDRDYPFHVHTVVRAPRASAVTAERIQQTIERLNAITSGQQGLKRIESILRGQLDLTQV